MEIRAYLRFFLRNWKTILFVFVITVAATAFFTFTSTPVYQATATYIVRLSTLAVDQKTTISALDTLSNRGEIAATYARVANSKLIRKRAADVLALSSSDLDGVSVSSQIVTGTNLLEITVQGSKPEVARDYANAIGQQVVTYVQSLYEIYALEILDEATLPRSSIKPNLTVNLVMGGIFGLILGIALGFFVEYLRAPMDTKAVFNILDEKTGVYNKRFFMLRLHQELNRAQRKSGALSVAMFNIDHRRIMDNVSSQSRVATVRSVVTMLGKNLRDEDIMAPFSETELIIMLPDLDGKSAKAVMEKLLESVSLISIELGSSGQEFNLHGAAGIASLLNHGDPVTAEELIANAQSALESMRSSSYGRATLYSESYLVSGQKEKKT